MEIVIIETPGSEDGLGDNRVPSDQCYLSNGHTLSLAKRGVLSSYAYSGYARCYCSFRLPGRGTNSKAI